MKNCLLVVIVLCPLAVFGQLMPEKENPGSLLKSGYVNPLTDKVARNVGDILTVIVQEASLSNYAATTQTSKSDSASYTPNFVVDFFSRLFRPFGSSSSASTKGDGKTTYTSNMTGTMSVVVKQVLPNGSLLIEGRRSLTTNKDTQTMVLSGVVRPFDVKPDNTVLSTQIADAQIQMTGKGQIQDRQRKGLINQLLDWLF